MECHEIHPRSICQNIIKLIAEFLKIFSKRYVKINYSRPYYKATEQMFMLNLGPDHPFSHEKILNEQAFLRYKSTLTH